MNELVIGILGGMGPQATANFYSRLIERTDAIIDQDHFHVIIDSNAKIYDRTAFILGNAASPLPQLLASGARLQQAGAEILAIPCITAHYFVDQLRAQLDIPIISAVEQVAQSLKPLIGPSGHVGILATSGTRQMKLFDRHLSDYQLSYPTEAVQRHLVMSAIYGASGIKANGDISSAKAKLIEAANQLIGQGAQAIIAGCTEIPLALQAQDISVHYLNAMDSVITKLLAIAAKSN